MTPMPDTNTAVGGHEFAPLWALVIFLCVFGIVITILFVYSCRHTKRVFDGYRVCPDGFGVHCYYTDTLEGIVSAHRIDKQYRTVCTD